jgi:hypothetical protein
LAQSETSKIRKETMKLHASHGALWSCLRAVAHHDACMLWRIMMLRACHVCALTIMRAFCRGVLWCKHAE